MNTKASCTTLVASVSLLLGSVAPAAAQVSIGIGLPQVSIGINIPVFPEFARVPGYPVYYAPGLNANYFFYDGMYWVYQADNWYASSWYNGPWGPVAPVIVPAYLLRVPVRYYRQPPRHFHQWQADAPPHWGEHWGHDWEQRRRGWDQWDRSSSRRPAPLPVYQREYSGDRYPDVKKQGVVRTEHYPYRPRKAVVRRHYEAERGQGASAPAPHGGGARPGKGAPQKNEGGHGSGKEKSDKKQDEHGKGAH
jgi:hypothetical protein